MDNMSSGKFMAHSPPRSPTRFAAIAAATSSPIGDPELLLQELIAERKNLSPFMSVLPNCCGLLNQEITRVTTLLANAPVLDQSARELASQGYSNEQANVNMAVPACRPESSSPKNFLGSQPQGSSSGLKVKKSIKIDIPVDQYPYVNIMGYLIGQNGSTLKQIEAMTSCRVFIQGRGSKKDPIEEEILRITPGLEHFNEPLHILVTAELPHEIIDYQLMQARRLLENVLNEASLLSDERKLAKQMQQQLQLE